MRKSRAFLIVLAAVVPLLAALVPMATTSNAGAADAPKVLGYILLTEDQGATCDLATVDWATGTVTDLSAPTSADACAHDLAVSPSGVVYGLGSTQDRAAAAFAPAAPSQTLDILVTYAADGTATRTDLAASSGFYRSYPAPGGIAVDANGVIYVLVNGLWADVVTCEASASPPLMDTTAGASDGQVDSVPCLFTANPSTGALTLVGSAQFLGIASILSIGSDEMRTVSLELTNMPVSIAPSLVGEGWLWSTIDPSATERGRLETSMTTATQALNGFDALRSGVTVYGLDFDEASGSIYTTTVDPATDTITRVAKTNTTKLSVGSLAVTVVPEPPTTTTSTSTTTTVPEDVVVPKITG